MHYAAKNPPQGDSFKYITGCSAVGSAPALGSVTECRRWRKKRGNAGAAVEGRVSAGEPPSGTATRASKAVPEGAAAETETKQITGCSAAGSAPALGAGCRRFESCHSDHSWTPVLIQCVSKRVSSFFLQKPLFTRVFLYDLTKAGSTVILKWSPWSLFRFTPLYHLTKGLWGVHFEPRGVHL